MTFKHKLASRLARLKDLTAWAAALTVAFVFACEKPIAVTGPGSNIAQLVVSPKNVTLQPNQTQDFLAVGLTATGDSADVSVTWTATGGSVSGSSNGKRHYGHYQNAYCGSFQVVATSTPGNLSDAASVTVTGCTVPVASVSVTPSTATVLAGQTVQLTATPKDANGNPLSGRTVTWSSNNTSVAVADVNGKVTGVAPGSATITATSEGQSGTAAITVTSVPVASVTVSPASASVGVGQTVQLTATPKDANGNTLSGRVVTWSSGNTSAATVNGSGLVSGVAAGSATITATSEGQSGTSAITVTGAGPGCATSTTAFQNSAFTSQNGSFTATFDATPNGAGLDAATGLSSGPAAAYTDMAVILRFNTGNTIDARNGGAYAAANSIPYTAGTSYHFRVVVDVSSHTYSAYVTPAGSAEQTIGTGFAFRTEQAAVTSLANWTLTAITPSHTVCNFAIAGSQPPVPVATVTLAPASATLDEGQTQQLTATLKDASGNVLTGRSITWSSSNSSAATVSASGLVTGVVAGSATITATSEGQSGTSAITVVHTPVASVTVAPASATLNEGQTQQLTATLRDANGNTLTGRSLTWSSSNSSAATVSASGLVTGVVAGSATITATSEGQSGTSAITVVHLPVASVTVTPASATVTTGSTVQLTATPKDANGNSLTGRTVTWQSSNTAAATVNGSGLVTGVAAGSATITATSEGQSGTSAITVAAPGTSQFGHVFIVTEENTDYVDVTSSSMPYLTGLAAQYGLATQYYANTHPSIGNYFELATGQVLTNDDGSSTIENVPNIVRSLVAAGKTWKSYAESIPNACYLGGDTGNYARKHNVFALLSDVANDPTGQACNNVPFTQFATDLANGTLPAFSNIVPDLCNDAHDCSLGTADSWLRTNIGPLLASPVFQQDGLLIVVFDESGGDNAMGGGRVYWAAISPKAKRGYQSTTTYQHPSTLRLILKGLGINSFPGAAATAPDMSEFFNP